MKFAECRELKNLKPFEKDDLIEVRFSGNKNFDGGFLIEKTPNRSTTLLLVIEARSNELAFQSFAFPNIEKNADYAQLVVIDEKTSGRRHTHAVLSLEDHIVASKDDGSPLNRNQPSYESL